MKIKTEDWTYECDDGCCYDWGTNLFIDDEFVGSYATDSQLIELLVTKLKPDAVVEFDY